MPQRTSFRLIRVRASDVVSAISSAQAKFADWQAECLEIALIPAVKRRWQAANRDRYPAIHLRRVAGQPYRGMTRAEAEQICQERGWLAYSGYELHLLAGEVYAWNRARADYYGHSPATAWNGMGRETYCSFIEDIRQLVYAMLQGTADRVHPELLAHLRSFGVEVVDDLAEARLEIPATVTVKAALVAGL